MGLSFDILAVDAELVYERRGRVNRITGIHSQWFHHPEALRVPEAIFGEFADAFRSANADFNYYGPTVYRDREILRLRSELRIRLEVKELDGDSAVRRELLRKILAITEIAIDKNQAVVVLGI